MLQVSPNNLEARQWSRRLINFHGQLIVECTEIIPLISFLLKLHETTWNYNRKIVVMWCGFKLWNIVFAKHKTQGITPFNSQVKRRVSELRRNVACVRREALEGAAYCNRKSNNHDQAPVPKAEEGLCWSTRINPRASSFPSSIWPGTKVLICGSFFRLRHNWPGSQMVRKCGKPWKHLPGSAALPAVLEGGAQRCACCSICVHNLFNKLSISTVVITSIY